MFKSGVVGIAGAAAAMASLLLAVVAPPRVDQKLLTLINEARADRRYRAETGGAAAPLRWNAAVAAVAQRHAEEMARAGRLSHLSDDGEDLGARLHDAGVAWTRVGENVAMAPSIEQAEAMLMAEPPFQPNHRANILDRRFTEVGLGVATVSGAVWITEDFLTH
ncbi:MAG TPA: CAP domain-containing protein [Terriglobales bacterium]|nr:CAP domain-containing protein [Terriglobales bacterium]